MSNQELPAPPSTQGSFSADADARADARARGPSLRAMELEEVRKRQLTTTLKQHVEATPAPQAQPAFPLSPPGASPPPRKPPSGGANLTSPSGATTGLLDQWNMQQRAIKIENRKHQSEAASILRNYRGNVDDVVAHSAAPKKPVSQQQAAAAGPRAPVVADAVAAPKGEGISLAHMTFVGSVSATAAHFSPRDPTPPAPAPASGAVPSKPDAAAASWQQGSKEATVGISGSVSAAAATFSSTDAPPVPATLGAAAAPAAQPAPALVPDVMWGESQGQKVSVATGSVSATAASFSSSGPPPLPDALGVSAQPASAVVPDVVSGGSQGQKVSVARGSVSAAASTFASTAAPTVPAARGVSAQPASAVVPDVVAGSSQGQKVSVAPGSVSATAATFSSSGAAPVPGALGVAAPVSQSAPTVVPAVVSSTPAPEPQKTAAVSASVLDINKDKTTADVPMGGGEIITEGEEYDKPSHPTATAEKTDDEVGAGSSFLEVVDEGKDGSPVTEDKNFTLVDRPSSAETVELVEEPKISPPSSEDTEDWVMMSDDEKKSKGAIATAKSSGARGGTTLDSSAKMATGMDSAKSSDKALTKHISTSESDESYAPLQRQDSSSRWLPENQQRTDKISRFDSSGVFSSATSDDKVQSIFRCDINFSFGVLTRQGQAPPTVTLPPPGSALAYGGESKSGDDRDSTIAAKYLKKFMNATAHVVDEALMQRKGVESEEGGGASRSESVLTRGKAEAVFDPDVEPFVRSVEDDVFFSPPQSRPNIVRCLVKATVPVFLHNAIEETDVANVRAEVLEALRSAVANGSFMDDARKSSREGVYA